MERWQRLSKQTVLEHSSFLSVESHTVQLPNGEIIPDWPIVITPDYVDVLAEDTAGKFLIFRQYKYAVNGQTLAPVGGYLEPGEDQLVGAKRELLEETGYISDQWINWANIMWMPTGGWALPTCTWHVRLGRYNRVTRMTWKNSSC
jgi:ADP-ribose pyrophosphatase